jgi:3-deoxy-D-manno-octulosonic-acid transferase
LAKLLYDLFLRLFALAFRIASPFNNKAKLGVEGRKDFFSKIKLIEPVDGGPVVWMHCSSLGEFEQGRPVLESLRQQYPSITIVLTFFSASGFEVMKNYTGAGRVYYLPLDSASNAKKVIDALNPDLVLWVKYEFWFYYLHELKQRNIPLILISGIFRPGQPFFKWYGKIWKQMLNCFTHLFVQNEVSVDLLNTLCFNKNVSISGDTRFDRVIAIAAQFQSLPLIENFCSNSKIMVAGSTWEDDEAELTHYVKANPQVKFIIAPHEIDEENLKDVQTEFPGALLYSQLKNDEPKTAISNQFGSNVLIIDNVGMLSRLYHYADITYVGGGFGADGVHNVLEAAVYGKPVVYGPEYGKYAEAIGLVECGGGIPIENALELETVLNKLWQDKDLLIAKGNAAKEFVYANAGATNKIVQFIQENRLLTN